MTDGNEGVLRIPQSSSIAGTSPSDCLVSYPGHSAEKHSVHSTAPADWAMNVGIKYPLYFVYISTFFYFFLRFMAFEFNLFKVTRYKLLPLAIFIVEYFLESPGFNIGYLDRKKTLIFAS